MGYENGSKEIGYVEFSPKRQLISLQALHFDPKQVDENAFTAYGLFGMEVINAAGMVAERSTDYNSFYEHQEEKVSARVKRSIGIQDLF